MIRRSLSGTAHSLFRSLLQGSAGSPNVPVSAEGIGMFDEPSGHEPAVIRRFRPDSEPERHLGGHSDEHDISPAMRARDFDELIDRIVAKLEHRILEDLERRGRRGMPEVF